MRGMGHVRGQETGRRKEKEKGRENGEKEKERKRGKRKGDAGGIRGGGRERVQQLRREAARVERGRTGTGRRLISVPGRRDRRERLRGIWSSDRIEMT